MVWTEHAWKHRWSDSRELVISHGRVAYRSGKRRSQNPYPAASVDAINWEYGWKSARTENHDSAPSLNSGRLLEFKSVALCAS